jgi:ABC-type sulfate transport system permease component
MFTEATSVKKGMFPEMSTIEPNSPTALPTESPLGVNVAYTRTAIAVALLFVTLPFVVRAVQPVLL